MPSVIVTCDGVDRTVFINNQNQGRTDTLLSVPVGLHVFDLGLPANYLPAFQQIFIDNAPDPAVVPFTLIAALVQRSRARLARSRKAARATKSMRVRIVEARVRAARTTGRSAAAPARARKPKPRAAKARARKPKAKSGRKKR